MRQDYIRDREIRLSWILFYTLYFLYILLFCSCLYCDLRDMEAWLAQYEAADMDRKLDIFRSMIDPHAP